MRQYSVVIIFLSFVGLIAILWFVLYRLTAQNPKASIVVGKVHQIKLLPDQIRKERHDHRIVVLTWNIGFGHGRGSDGLDYQPQDKQTYQHHLDAIANIIQKENVDIAFLQEIDFGSKRSHYMNQADYLASRSALSYVASLISWHVGYVPFPAWPVTHHFGKVVSGGVVLSRFPLRSQFVQYYDKPSSNAWWYNAFYLARYSQYVEVLAGKSSFWVVNNHFEAFDQQNRINQAHQLRQAIADWQNLSPLWIVAGDFNTVPETATQKYQFMDNSKDDYRGDQTWSILKSVPGFYKADTEPTQGEHSSTYTFPSWQPNRQLDDIFVATQIKVLSYKVIKDIDEASDHLPIVVELQLPE